MKRLSALLRGDPSRRLPLGSRTPAAGSRTGSVRVAELQSGRRVAPFVEDAREVFCDVDDAEHNALCRECGD
jgi:hypothetical protein